MGKTLLSKEDLKYGVALVDIGAGVTTLSIYREGTLRYCATIPFGGSSVTRDLEEECTIEWELAEKIKKRFGICVPDKLGNNKDKVLQLRICEPYKEIPVKYISEVISARYGEIAEAVLYNIQESGLQNSIRGGIVLVGGAAVQQNLDALFRDITGYNVRRAKAGISAAHAMAAAACDDGIPDCAKDISNKETLFEDEEKEKEKEENKNAEYKKPEERKEPEGDEDNDKGKPGVFRLMWDSVQGFLKKAYDELGQE